MKPPKYMIILFCNKKRDKYMAKSRTRSKILEVWHELKTEKPPPYIRKIGKKRNNELVYELALIFPHTRWSTKTYVRDSFGRNVEAQMEDERYRIKEIIPYWKEELVYDFEEKKRVRYHQMMEKIQKIDDICQIFTLNNKIFVQVEGVVKMFGNKNIDDALRLFEIIRKDLIKKKRMNFIFVKDISTQQRKKLYEILESMGYKRTELFRHYSY